MANKTEQWTADDYQNYLKQGSKSGKKKKKPIPKWNILNPDQNRRSQPTPENDRRDLVTEIIFPGVLPGNNGENGLLRMPHWKRTELKERLVQQVHVATRHRHRAPVRLELIRHSYGPEMDYDNLVSTGKIPIDAIVIAGVIPDDKKAVITEREYTQTRALKPELQMTVIRIIDLPL